MFGYLFSSHINRFVNQKRRLFFINIKSYSYFLRALKWIDGNLVVQTKLNAINRGIVGNLLNLITPLFFLFFSYNSVHAQENTEIFQTGFIENHDENGVINQKFPYYCFIGGIKVEFSKNKINYVLDALYRHKEKDKKNRSVKRGTNNDEDGESKIIPIFESVGVNYVNASEHASIIPLSERKAYMMQHGKIKSKVYDKLTFKNVWPNIDIEFMMHPEGGLKYNLIINVGADLKMIQLDYSEFKQVSLHNNVLFLHSPIGIWREHAPVTFSAQGNEVPSSYQLENKILSFVIENFSPNEQYVIDPWVELLPSPTSYASLPPPADSVWVYITQVIGTGINNNLNRVQIDYDQFGNIYMVQTAMLQYFIPDNGINDFIAVVRFVHKYSPDGNLIFSVNQGYEFGTFNDISVNKVSGEIYCQKMIKKLMHLAPDGTLLSTLDLDLFPTAPTEICSIQYDHCQDSVLIGFGGNFQAQPSFLGKIGPTIQLPINYSFAYNVSPSFVSWLPYNDNIDVLIDPYSTEYYSLFLLRTFNFATNEDRALLKTDANMNSMYQNNGPFLSFTELRAHLVGEVSGPGRMHFEALACGRDFVYGTNGGELLRWDKNTGTLLNTIVLPGGILTTNRAEGIDVDINGNVYVGGNNSVLVYSPNLTFIQSIPLTNMPQDIHVFGKNLYIAQDFQLEVKNIANIQFWTSISTVDSCGQCTGTASVSFPGTNGLPPNTSIVWSANGDTTLTTSGLCSGWQKFTIFETKNCIEHAYLDSVFVDDWSLGCPLAVTLQGATICEGDCIEIIAQVNYQQGAVTYNWSTGITTTTNSILVCPTDTTFYEVSVVDSTGATASSSTTVLVLPDFSVNLGNDTVLCTDQTILLDAFLTDASYLWQDGSSSSNFFVNNPGTYSVQVDNGGCIRSDSIMVNYTNLVSNLPLDTAVCNPFGLQLDAGNPGSLYLWSDGSTGQFYSSAGFGEVWVEISDGFCTISDTTEILLGSLTLDLGPDTVFCAGVSSVLNSGLQTGNFVWSNGSTNSSINISQSGVYWLNVVDGFCSASDTISITVSQIDVSFGVSDTIGCDPLQVDFTDLSESNPGNIISWLWDLGDNTLSSDQNPSVTYTSSGIRSISLTVSNNFGCTATQSENIEIIVIPSPTANFSISPSAVFSNDVVQFNDASTNATSWLWDFGNGTFSNSTNPTYTYENSGTYDVVLIVTNENCVDTAAATLTVKDPFFIYVPNAFTPDGNEFNQVFKPILSGSFDPYDYQLIIFNRWGEVVFESFNVNIGWDGSYGTEVAPDGNYIWKIILGNKNSASKEIFTGHFSLLK
jgi:gliding motility-associated-like protein